MRFALVSLALVGCSGEPECIAFDASCTPLYAPEFEMIHARTLKPSCAQAGGFCHTADGNAGGMNLEEIEGAYVALSARVKPGDASCSLLSERLESEESDFQMPPGNRIKPEARCAIEQWIAGGAKR